MHEDTPKIPRLQPALITKETGISLALVITLLYLAYNHGIDKGKAEARDKDFLEMKNDMIKIREMVHAMEKNIITICDNTPRCRTRGGR